jgi:hypothetical protein
MFQRQYQETQVMSGFRTLALAATLAVAASSLAYAQNPVSAAIGAAGNIAGAAVGAAGTVAGTAVGAAAGTVGAVVAPYPYGYRGYRCPRGYHFDEGACYLR